MDKDTQLICELYDDGIGLPNWVCPVHSVIQRFTSTVSDIGEGIDEDELITSAIQGALHNISTVSDLLHQWGLSQGPHDVKAKITALERIYRKRGMKHVANHCNPHRDLDDTQWPDTRDELGDELKS